MKKQKNGRNTLNLRAIQKLIALCLKYIIIIDSFTFKFLNLILWKIYCFCLNSRHIVFLINDCI